jgi:GDP-L-fucose synthase
MLREIMGHKGQVVYNKTKPDGQPRRCLLTSKAKKEFGFSAEIKLKEGLKETVEWYFSNKKVGV